ncbi:MAG: hypothetical protein GF335_02345 [Candidatus Moranbacteria bacterium]|nr:hypothetical protein [Candidatus Moranbacteria bacterium]
MPDISKKTLELRIYRWLKKGEIISLKRGVYILKENYLKYYQDPRFAEFLAGIIKYPSYLSLEYVLSKYNILTEGTFGITSVTLKTGSIVQNKVNSFVYRNIKKANYFGFIKRYFLHYEYFEASKEKALLDYLYYKKRSLAKNYKNRDLIFDLRLNLDVFSKDDFKKLDEMTERMKSDKLRKIINNIVQNAPHN